MSLLDALLLDPYRDPREIWIALRTDGQRGSGTQSDPYDGSSRPYPTLTVSQLTYSASTGKATATTSGNHGLATGDLVTIGGADIQLANLGDNYYVGTFEITFVSATSFSYSLLGVPDSATAPAPAGGSIQCWREREMFDVVMRSVAENSVIHLGVGVFETKGKSQASGGWTAKSGQRFLGSGMGLTTLKLVNASAVKWPYAAIFASSVDGFEVSDLTVDCNVDGQLSPLTNCGAIDLIPVARHVRIRRVRAINFGSNGPLGPLASAYSENFVFFVGGTDIVDIVYEDCVAEQPAPNVAWNSTILHQSGGYDETTGKVYYGRTLVLRNNYVNGQIVYGPRASVESLEVTGNVVTLTTRTPHGRSVPGNVSVQGVKVDGNTNNRFNGVFKIDQIVSETVLKYTAFSPNADLGEVTADTPRTLDGGTFMGAPVSPHQLGITLTYTASDKKTFHVKTLSPFAPHNLTINNKIRVGNVELNGFDPNDPQTPIILGSSSPNNPCNGLFRVTNVTSKTEFDYMADNAIDGQIIAAPYSFSGHSLIGQGHVFTHADIGTGAIVQGNRMLHGATGGPWHDTASTLDLVARDNYYLDIANGPVQHMGILVKPPKAAISLTRMGVIATFVVGTGQEHNLVVGQPVAIDKALVNASTDNPFNGYYVVKSILSANSFTYEMAAEPSTDAATSPAPEFQPVAQIANWSIENNIIELALSVLQGYWFQPTAVVMDIPIPDLQAKIPYAFRQVLVRRNVIRQVNGEQDVYHYGVTAHNTEKLLVENNVISVGGGSVQFKKSVASHFFNNMNPAGRLQRAYDQATMTNQSEISTMIEDATLLSL